MPWFFLLILITLLKGLLDRYYCWSYSYYDRSYEKTVWHRDLSFIFLLSSFKYFICCCGKNCCCLYIYMVEVSRINRFIIILPLSGYLLYSSVEDLYFLITTEDRDFMNGLESHLISTWAMSSLFIKNHQFRLFIYDLGLKINHISTKLLLSLSH